MLVLNSEQSSLATHFIDLVILLKRKLHLYVLPGSDSQWTMRFNQTGLNGLCKNLHAVSLMNFPAVVCSFHEE